MANHIASGAFFKDPPINDGKQHPVGHIALEVLGVKLNLAVWPAQTSGKGTKYSPVSGDYSIKETKRLIDVAPQVGSSANQSKADGTQADPVAASPTVDGEDLPF